MEIGKSGLKILFIQNKKKPPKRSFSYIISSSVIIEMNPTSDTTNSCFTDFSSLFIIEEFVELLILHSFQPE
jgi:hypothetical protein